MDYDVVVIGSGPGGYVCAIRCAQLGLKTAIIEKYSTFGGTCLNVGCIPSKALLDSSEHYNNANKHFKELGIKVDGLGVDWEQMKARKDKVVEDTCGGVAYLMKKNKIETFQGYGQLVDKNTVKILGDGEKTISTKNIVIATGSKPSSLPGIEIDKKRIITSTEALNLPEIPNKMIIIGGGVIGLELGSVMGRLGTKIQVIEYMDRIIPVMDKSMSKELQKSLKKLDFDFFMNHKVKSVENKGDSVSVVAEAKNGEDVTFEADYCLVSVGRRPYTDKLGLDSTGVETDQRGFVKVNEKLQTNVANVYAIGDVIGGAMLAHKAEDEGTVVAEIIAGQKPHIDYNTIPNVVYTWPEVSSVGKTEEQLKKEGIEFKTGSFSYKALGRARAANESEGLIRVYASKKDDEILGVHMFGARVADLIAEAVVAMEYKASAEDIARTCHAHPTFTEAFKEACLAATENRAIHV